MAFPSRQAIANAYADGLLQSTTTPEGIINYYYSCGGKLGEVTKGGESVSFLYDGSLLTSDTRAGTVNAALSWGYDSDLRPSTFTYAGGTVSFGYDNDSLLTSASGFTIGRDAQNGLPRTVSDPGYALAQTRTFSGYGEVDGVGTVLNGTAPYSWSVTRDNAGRILHRTETVAGSPIAWAYRYDEVGRLVEVKKDGVIVEEYGYDPNGNRTGETNSLRGISRTLEYDLEDKVITAGSDSYSFDVDGFLTSRVTAGGLATFDYSSRGELLSASLPGYGATQARTITYLHDPMGRRIAKQVNGVTVEKYLWSGATTLLAVYDGTGAVRDRFLYADGRLPVAMIRGGTRYFLLTDQVGSVRAVAMYPGTIVKRVDYDSFGNILADTNPGFVLPFGFAGGLHDRDTGLVRFGARDYDPGLGRWTAKDPIDFAGGDENLYGYVLNNPICFFDPEGLKYAEIYSVTGAIAGGTIIAGASIVVDAATGGLNILATPAEIAAGSAIGGAIGYGVGTLLDWATGNTITSCPTVPELGNEMYAKGERNWEKGRGDDPFWNLPPERLREIEKDPKSTPREKERAKKIRKQKEKSK